MLICIGLLSFFFLMNHKTADNMTEQPPSLNLEPEATQDSVLRMNQLYPLAMKALEKDRKQTFIKKKIMWSPG